MRSGASSALGQFWLGGKSLDDLTAWETVAASTGVGGASGVAVQGLFDGVSRLGGPSFLGEPNANLGNIVRGATGLPSGGINYALNFPRPILPPTESTAAIPAGDWDWPLPRVPHLQPPPRRIGGGTHTVAPGDSLWQIAATRLGDPTLWPKIWAANPHIAHPDHIEPGDIVVIPTLRRPAIAG